MGLGRTDAARIGLSQMVLPLITLIRFLSWILSFQCPLITLQWQIALHVAQFLSPLRPHKRIILQAVRSLPPLHSNGHPSDQPRQRPLWSCLTSAITCNPVRLTSFDPRAKATSNLQCPVVGCSNQDQSQWKWKRQKW